MTRGAPDLMVSWGWSVGWRSMKPQAGIRLPEVDSGEEADDVPHGGAEGPPKIPRPSRGGSKLEFQGFPWTQAGPAEVVIR